MSQQSLSFRSGGTTPYPARGRLYKYDNKDGFPVGPILEMARRNSSSESQHVFMSLVIDTSPRRSAGGTASSVCSRRTASTWCWSSCLANNDELVIFDEVISVSRTRLSKCQLHQMQVVQ